MKKYLLTKFACLTLLALGNISFIACSKSPYDKTIEAFDAATNQVKSAKSYEELVVIDEKLDAQIAEYEKETAPDFQPSDEQIERGDKAEKSYMQARHEAMSKFSEERALNIINKYTTEVKRAKSAEEIQKIRTKFSEDLIKIIEDFGPDFDPFSSSIAMASEKLEKTIEEVSAKF